MYTTEVELATVRKKNYRWRGGEHTHNGILILIPEKRKPIYLEYLPVKKTKRQTLPRFGAWAIHLGSYHLSTRWKDLA